MLWHGIKSGVVEREKPGADIWEMLPCTIYARYWAGWGGGFNALVTARVRSKAVDIGHTLKWKKFPHIFFGCKLLVVHCSALLAVCVFLQAGGQPKAGSSTSGAETAERAGRARQACLDG